MLGRAGVKLDVAGGPDRPWTGDRRKPRLDRGDQLDQRHAGVLANRHARGAGMVLLTLEFDPEPPAADDRGDDAEAQMVVFQVGALLDMGLQIAAIARGIHLLARPAGKPGLPQRIAQRHPGLPVRADVDLLLRQQAAE